MDTFELLHVLLALKWEWTAKGCITCFILALPKILNAIFFLYIKQSVPRKQLKDGGLFLGMAAWKWKKLCARIKCQARPLAGNLLAWRMLQIKSTLRWLITVSSTFRDEDFDGSFLPVFITWCYNHGIRKLPNHRQTHWYHFRYTIGYHSNTMTC